MNLTDSPLIVGHFFNPDDPKWATNGTIDEVAIYSKVLSEEEIKSLYQAKRAKFIEFVNGKCGKAIEFDGVDDYVRVNHSESLNITDRITVAAIITPTNVTKPVSFVAGKRLSKFSWQFVIGQPDTSYPPDASFTLYQSDGINERGIWQAGTLESGKTYYLVGLADGVKIKVFINGKNAGIGINGETFSNYDGTIQPSPDPILIGQADLNPNRYFNGTIDEIIIYNRSLSEDEIKRTHLLSFLVRNPSSAVIPNLQMTAKIKNKYTNKEEIYTNKTFISLNPGEIKIVSIRIPEGDVEKVTVNSPCGVSIEYEPLNKITCN